MATAHFFVFIFVSILKTNATGPLPPDSKKWQENMVISYSRPSCTLDAPYKEISRHSTVRNKRNNNTLKGDREGWHKSRSDEDKHCNKGPGSLHCVTQLRSKDQLEGWMEIGEYSGCAYVSMCGWWAKKCSLTSVVVSSQKRGAEVWRFLQRNHGLKYTTRASLSQSHMRLLRATWRVSAERELLTLGNHSEVPYHL